MEWDTKIPLGRQGRQDLPQINRLRISQGRQD